MPLKKINTVLAAAFMRAFRAKVWWEAAEWFHGRGEDVIIVQVVGEAGLE